MLLLTQTLETFPSAVLPSCSGGLPVEVALIAQLGHGAGTHLIEAATARQRGHQGFVDALDEPSARLGGMDLAHGDASSLYSFTVGAQGHPFHRHAGQRTFTAISGSAGTQLRFSSATDAQIKEDPSAFVRALRHVHVPPDCLFTVRFGGGTWHQFVPLSPDTPHPALFALSCHTNELGGDLPEAVRTQVLDNAADIPSLTELLPEAVTALLRQLDPARVATVALSLDAPAASWHAAFCARFRSWVGRARGAWARLGRPRGYLADNGGGRTVFADPSAAGSLVLRHHLPEAGHTDGFSLDLPAGEIPPSLTPAQILEALLDGFLDNRPVGVTRLMSLRNTLVRPLRLRTSSLGCPVSSLLGTGAARHFSGRFPVLDAQVDATQAQVLLGADDRHLVFRSCVAVARAPDGRVRCTLATRVRTTNLFGQFYLAVIDRVHRGYIAPAMLRLAVDQAVRRLTAPAAPVDPASETALS